MNYRFHHISTFEVYGAIDETGLFEEITRYTLNFQYSSGKESSDFIVRAYHHTFGMNTSISNCSNNYITKQHSEKLISIIVQKALNLQSILIYGDSKNIHDWLFVLHQCKRIDLFYHKGKLGDTYNIGGRNERTNLEIVNHICEYLDKKQPKSKCSFKDQITFVQDRDVYERCFAIDATKIENELAWKASEDF